MAASAATLKPPQSPTAQVSGGRNGQVAAEFEAEAAVALAGDNLVSPSVSSDEEGPVWPDAAAEAAYLSEQNVVPNGAGTNARPAVIVEEKANEALPSLDELVNRIPAETREVLDELFRARFVSVKRVPAHVLKTEN